MKKAIHPTLADSICDLRSRKIKTVFFDQINTILDWEKTSLLKRIPRSSASGLGS